MVVVAVAACLSFNKSKVPYKTSNSFFPPSFTCRVSSFTRGHQVLSSISCDDDV